MISYEAVKAFTFYKQTVQFVAGVEMMQLGHENIGLKIIKDNSIDSKEFSSSFKMIPEILEYYYNEFPITSGNTTFISSFVNASGFNKWKEMTVDVLVRRSENFAIYQYLHTGHFKNEFLKAVRHDFQFDIFGRSNHVDVNINEVLGEFEKFLDVDGATIKAYDPKTRTIDDFLFHCYHHYFKKSNDLKSIFNVIDLNKERGEGTSLVELKNSSDTHVNLHLLLRDIYTASSVVFKNVGGELLDDLYTYYIRKQYAEEILKVETEFTYIGFKNEDVEGATNAAHKLRCRRKLLSCFDELFGKNFNDYDVFRCFQAAMKLTIEYVPQKNGINFFYSTESKTNNTNTVMLDSIVKGIRAVNKLHDYAKSVGRVFIDSQIFRRADLNSRILTPEVLFNDYSNIMSVSAEGSQNVPGMLYNAYVYDHIRSSVHTIHKVLSQLQNVNLSFLDTLINLPAEKITPLIDRLIESVDKMVNETITDYTTLLIKIAEGHYEENDEVLLGVLFAKILSDYGIDPQQGTFRTNAIKLINSSEALSDTFSLQHQVADSVIETLNKTKYHVNTDDLANSINICGAFMLEYLRVHLDQVRHSRLDLNDKYAISCFAHDVNGLRYNPIFLQYLTTYNVNYVDITKNIKVLQSSGNSNVINLSRALMNATEYLRSVNTITEVVDIYARLTSRFQSNSGFLFHGYKPITYGDWYIHEFGYKIKECEGGAFVQEKLTQAEVEFLEQMYE